MKTSLTKILLVFCLIFLNNCDSNNPKFTRDDISFNKENLYSKTYKETPKLVIKGPFTKADKKKASRILAKILCKNEKSKVNVDKIQEIENQFKRKISEVSLEKGIENSPQVIKTAKKLKEYLTSDCEKLSISKVDEEDIYFKNFRFNK